MKLQTNKIFRKIKQHLVKKVTIFNCYEEDNDIIYQLRLSNFWTVKKSIKIFIENEENKKEIPFSLNKGILRIKLNKKHLTTVQNKAIIKIYINGQKMWIKSAQDFFERVEGMVIANNYISTHVEKNIILKRQFKEYSFSDRKYYIYNQYSTFEYLKFNIDDFSLNKNKSINIYAFRNNKIKILEAKTDVLDRGFIIDDFASISMGMWRLFLNFNGYLHPLVVDTSSRNLSIMTYKYNIVLINKYGNMCMLVKSHELKVETLKITRKCDSTQLEITSKNQSENAKYHLIMEDTTNNEEQKFLIDSCLDKLIVNIPNIEFLKGLNNKRFFVEKKESNVLKFQINLLSDIKGEECKFVDEYNNQELFVHFYKRKDNALGLKIVKPKLKKNIIRIKDFKLEGEITSLNKFVNCKTYLYIEERVSAQGIKVQIESHFYVDLTEIDLLSIKTKEKTVMDLFILIENEGGEVVRKEKIKYKYADYKKDNYYDYLLTYDSQSNQHHFLITTTPFNNLKLESFTIPNYIDIPEEIWVKDENVWLIGERYNTAQDNGYALFKWVQENTNIEIYYVIESDSEDYLKIKDDPYVLIFGSSAHYEVAFKAKVLLGTHDLENILPYKPAKGFFGYENTFKVFLQHGVLGRKNVEYHKAYYELPFDMFIVSSDPEKYDVVVKQLGYNEEEVEVTGLARFDNLVEKVKPRNILLMPTWRDWINTDKQFLESKYYDAYYKLIKNPKLLGLLEEYDVYLNFYPHYRAQKYFNKDMQDLDNRINFISLGSKTVQELLISHALLITDYSSVSFDFTLMNKPVIYYHFDVKRFFRKGILRPVEETFLGRIANTEEELIEFIEERIKNGFKNYEIDLSEIVKYQDEDNSKRIFLAIHERMASKSKEYLNDEFN